MADTIDLDSMAVDDKYTGPRIPDSGVDTNFMKVCISFNLIYNYLFHIHVKVMTVLKIIQN